MTTKFLKKKAKIHGKFTYRNSCLKSGPTPPIPFSAAASSEFGDDDVDVDITTETSMFAIYFLTQYNETIPTGVNACVVDGNLLLFYYFLQAFY